MVDDSGRVTVTVRPGSGRLGLEWGEGASSFPVVQSILPGSLFETSCPEVVPGMMKLTKIEGDNGATMVAKLGTGAEGFKKAGQQLMRAGLTQQGLTDANEPLVLSFSRQ